MLEQSDTGNYKPEEVRQLQQYFCDFVQSLKNPTISHTECEHVFFLNSEESLHLYSLRFNG